MNTQRAGSNASQIGQSQKGARGLHLDLELRKGGRQVKGICWRVESTVVQLKSVKGAWAQEILADLGLGP